MSTAALIIMLTVQISIVAITAYLYYKVFKKK